MTMQQSVLQFVESQAASVESRVRMILHGSIQYPDLVGVSREADPFADTITYYSYDGTGDMIFLSNRGNDYPFVQITQAQHNVNIEHLGLAYDWSDREIGRARQTGVSLPDRKTRIAFRIWEEKKDDLFINGDSDKGWDGFINIANVASPNASATFAASTGIEIANIVNEALGDVWDGTNQVRYADTLVLPPEQMNVLATKPIGDNANRNTLAYIKENNIYTQMTGNPLMIRTLRQLKGAGGTNSDRMVVYSRDMDVVRFHVPRELQFTEPQRRADTYVMYGSGVLAGLEVMEPGAFRYRDNI